jgi:hypothetical protein
VKECVVHMKQSGERDIDRDVCIEKQERKVTGGRTHMTLALNCQPAHCTTQATCSTKPFFVRGGDRGVALAHLLSLSLSLGPMVRIGGCVAAARDRTTWTR